MTNDKWYMSQPEERRRAAEKELVDFADKHAQNNTCGIAMYAEMFFNALFPEGACAISDVIKHNDDLNAIVSAQEGEIKELRARLSGLVSELKAKTTPVPMRIICPECKTLHIDEGEFATKPHSTHACQSCGNVWRPAIVATVGVRFLPGFKNDDWDGDE